MYKAYYATGKWCDDATVVFAESRGKAKSLAMASEALEGVEFLDFEVCRLDCDDPDYIASRNAIAGFANKFHRAAECGILKGE